MKTVAIIPARYASVRFPGKALALLGEWTIIRHVYERVKRAELFTDVFIATDSELIEKEAKTFTQDVIMTDSTCQSGSDRIAEALGKIGKNYDVVVNVQGDEPFIDKHTLSQLLQAFEDRQTEIATLIHKISAGEAANPNFVKVVLDKNNFALYFSRSLIPHNRDNRDIPFYLRHIGVYAYRQEALFAFVKMQSSQLEEIEKLEQLRLLENGYKIKCVFTSYQGIGIDTREDLQKAQILLNAKNFN